jgi:2,3-dihydroxybenzoate-AMP ligase
LIASRRARQALERRLVRWPHHFALRYREADAWRDETVADLIRHAARVTPEAWALVTTDERLSYRELDELSERAAAGLLVLGLEPGDRALFQLGNAADSAIAYYGAVKAGVIPVCAIPAHGERDMVALALQSDARAYFVQADFRSQDLQELARAVRRQAPGLEHVVVTRGAAKAGVELERLLESHDAASAQTALAAVEVEPDDVVVFQLSGGTTGTPKIIPRLHCEYVLNSRCWAQACGWTSDSVVMHPIPLIHNAGISAAMQPTHLVQGTFVLAPKPDPETTMRLIQDERVQVLPVVPPAILLRLLEHPERSSYDLSSLTHLIVGGQKLPADLADRVESELGIPCLQMFGMAEGMFLRTPDAAPEWVRKHTVGCRISELDEVRILDPGTENEVPLGAVGELCCRGPYTIRGYFDAPAHNAAAFTSDGFYRTGDLARAHIIDGQLHYSVEGRIKDVINRGAEKINAEEVEDVLFAHPSVEAVAVVAIPDRELGERACACVVLEQHADGLTLEELVSHASAEGLARFKLPERLEIVEALPLANIGKVDKKALREQMLERL